MLLFIPDYSFYSGAIYGIVHNWHSLSALVRIYKQIITTRFKVIYIVKSFIQMASRIIAARVDLEAIVAFE